MPSIQLISNETFSFWCIKDSSLPEGTVNINSKFAQHLKLKSGSNVKYL